ncbi:MAG: Fic family protein [Pseudomonadota bacterium]
MRYIYHLSGWPNFRWQKDLIATLLAGVRHRQGRLIGRMEGLGFDLRNEAVLTTLTDDVLKSSEIEGENLDVDQVRSSIARRLGLDISGLIPADRDVEGVVEMMLDATQRYHAPLTEDRLFGWHASLFPTGRSGISKIAVGAWRDAKGGPMQVVSGSIGREKVHFQALDSERLGAEMAAFLVWFEEPSDLDAVLKAALAHLWFVTIHPFDDGNGRIARAIADMALTRSEGSAQRFYSMSAEIRKRRKGYYEVLENTQKGDLDITPWLLWFLECLDGAIARSEGVLQHIFAKSRFWEAHRNTSFNDRQRKMLSKLLDGFQGRLTTSKWAKITKCSQDTALRDIEGLIHLGVMEKEPGGGRSTSYALVTLMNG